MDTPSKHTACSISFFKRNELDYIVVALLTLLIFFIAIKSFGLGITNDSVNYLSAAQSFPQGLNKADGSPYTEWPPLFPVLLSIAHIVHLDLLSFSVLFQGIVLISINLIALYILKTNLQSRPILCLGIILLIFSAPVLQMHVMLWSEPFFLLLILLNLIILKHYLSTLHLKFFILLIGLGMLMYLQRKTGIVFIASTAVLLFLLIKQKRKGFLFSLLYLMPCAIPIYLWYNRRFKIAGQLLGEGEFKPDSFSTILEQLAHTFSSYFLPSAIPLIYRIIFLAILFLIVSAAILKSRKIKDLLINNFYFKASFFIIISYYAALLLLLVYIQIDDKVDDRILAPAYLPLFLSGMILVDSFYAKLKIPIFLLLLGVWLLYPLVRTGYHLYRWNTSGTGGYNSISWSENKIISHYLSSKSEQDTLFTNSIYPLKYFLNFKAGKKFIILPQKAILKGKVMGQLICFPAEWVYPYEKCLGDNIVEKKQLLKNEHGKIWLLNNP